MYEESFIRFLKKDFIFLFGILIETNNTKNFAQESFESRA